MSFSIRPRMVFAISGIAMVAVGLRAVEAIRSLGSTDVSAFLAFPLAVFLPAVAFLFVATRKSMASEEGVLMQLGTMFQLALIIALPRFALYLALGFPVVFLVVELFETRAPATLRNVTKRLVLRAGV